MHLIACCQGVLSSLRSSAFEPWVKPTLNGLVIVPSWMYPTLSPSSSSSSSSSSSPPSSSSS
eukprot:9412422-Pyramimonas_sp.AAC.2